MSSASDISMLQRESYSARIEMFLHVSDRKLNIGRIREGVMTLRETCSVPENTPAIVGICMDGETDYTSIVLHRGIQVGTHVVEFTKAAS